MLEFPTTFISKGDNMKFQPGLLTAALLFSCLPWMAQAQTDSAAASNSPPNKAKFDAELAKTVGADEMGMKPYIFVLLKTGPNKMPPGPERDEMFKGHFANIKHMTAQGKLTLAGPLDGVDGWRGLFILAVTDMDEAKKLIAADPVIIKGEMIAEYHKFYGSAALMLLPDAHNKVAKKSF